MGAQIERQHFREAIGQKLRTSRWIVASQLLSRILCVSASVRSVTRGSHRFARDQNHLFSVVIPTRDNYAMAMALAKKLVSRHNASQVIIVNNRCASRQLVRAIDVPSGIAVIQGHPDWSFSYSCNVALNHVETPYVVVANDDVIVRSAGAVASLIKILATDSEAGAVAGIAISRVTEVPRARIVHVGAVWSPIQRRFERNLLSVRRAAALREAIEAEFLSMHFTAFRSDIIKDLQFDTRYFFGWEDMDLSLRLRRIGLKLFISPDCVLSHTEMTTRGLYRTSFHSFMANKNQVLFLQKWLRELEYKYKPQLESYALVGSTYNAAANPPPGDVPVQEGLAAGLRALGVSCSTANDETSMSKAGCKIQLLHDHQVQIPTAEINAVWIRNWLDEWLSRDDFDDADIVFHSIENDAEARKISHAETHLVQLAATLSEPQPVLPLEARSIDVLWSMSNWNMDERYRRAPFRLSRGQHGVAVGMDTGARPPWHDAGPVSYGTLRDLFRHSRIAIDDSPPQTRGIASINHRVFDALSDGCVVVSTNKYASEQFPAVIFAESSAQFQDVVSDCLSSIPEMQELVTKSQELVHNRGTWERRAQAVNDHVQRLNAQPQILIVGSWPNSDERRAWGDYFFARALQDAFRRIGLRCQVRSFQQESEIQSFSNVLCLLGLSAPTLSPQANSCGWIISHPDLYPPHKLGSFDHIFSASQRHVDELTVSGIQAEYLEQTSTLSIDSYICSHPQYENIEECLVLIGSPRGVHRRFINWAIQEKIPVRVFGPNWAGWVPPKFVEAEVVPDCCRRQIYHRALAVLCDHWLTMLDYEIVSNRIFEVLHSGGIALTEPGIARAVHHDCVIGISSRAELREVYERLQGLTQTIRSGMSSQTSAQFFDTEMQNRARSIALRMNLLQEAQFVQ